MRCLLVHLFSKLKFYSHYSVTLLLFTSSLCLVAAIACASCMVVVAIGDCGVAVVRPGVVPVGTSVTGDLPAFNIVMIVIVVIDSICIIVCWLCNMVCWVLRLSCCCIRLSCCCIIANFNKSFIEISSSSSSGRCFRFDPTRLTGIEKFLGILDLWDLTVPEAAVPEAAAAEAAVAEAAVAEATVAEAAVAEAVTDAPMARSTAEFVERSLLLWSLSSSCSGVASCNSSVSSSAMFSDMSEPALETSALSRIAYCNDLALRTWGGHSGDPVGCLMR